MINHKATNTDYIIGLITFKSTNSEIAVPNFYAILYKEQISFSFNTLVYFELLLENL